MVVELLPARVVEQFLEHDRFQIGGAAGVEARGQARRSCGAAVGEYPLQYPAVGSDEGPHRRVAAVEQPLEIILAPVVRVRPAAEEQQQFQALLRGQHLPKVRPWHLAQQRAQFPPLALGYVQHIGVVQHELPEAGFHQRNVGPVLRRGVRQPVVVAAPVEIVLQGGQLRQYTAEGAYSEPVHLFFRQHEPQPAGEGCLRLPPPRGGRARAQPSVQALVHPFRLVLFGEDVPFLSFPQPEQVVAAGGVRFAQLRPLLDQPGGKLVHIGRGLLQHYRNFEGASFALAFLGRVVQGKNEFCLGVRLRVPFQGCAVRNPALLHPVFLGRGGRFGDHGTVFGQQLYRETTLEVPAAYGPAAQGVRRSDVPTRTKADETDHFRQWRRVVEGVYVNNRWDVERGS